MRELFPCIQPRIRGVDDGGTLGTIMKIFLRQKTDDEYIKTIRNSYRRRWFTFALFFIFFILVIVATFYYFGNKFITPITELNVLSSSDVKPSVEVVNRQREIFSQLLGIRIGFILSAGIYFGMLGIVFSILTILYRRKDIMLLKYYDKNNNS